MRTAVLGATGFVGRALVPALAQHSEVVAVSRRATAPELPGVRCVAADLTNRESTRGALDGVDVAYHLVHSLGTGNFSELDRRVAENVAAEAERAGVAQIVYLGGLGDDAPDLSAHLRSRTETGAVLSSGTVPVTTLRAAVVVGRGSAAFETIVALVDRLPVMVAPRWVSTPTQPIALTDTIRYLTASRAARRPGRNLRRRRPEVITYREMIQQIARLRAKRPLIIEVPVLSPRLSSYWLHLVTPVGARVARRSSRGCATHDRARKPDPRPAPIPPHQLRRRGTVRARARVSSRRLPGQLADRGLPMRNERLELRPQSPAVGKALPSWSDARWCVRSRT